MEPKLSTWSGKVVQEKVDEGSKSERGAVVLKTDQGESYVLRRRGGPSFGDTSLEPLVGSSIVTDGVALGRTLIMNNWRTQD